MNTPRELTDLETRMVAQSYKAFTESPAGRDLTEYLDEMVSSSLTAIRECTNYQEASELVIRFQQREGVATAITNHINEWLETLGGGDNNGNEPNYPDTGSSPDADTATDSDADASTSSTGY